MKTAISILIFILSFSCLGNNLVLDDIRFPKAEFINEHTARIPFKLVDRLMVVEAELLDQRGDFIIDTGSESVILNTAHFKVNPFNKNNDHSFTGVISDLDVVHQRSLQEFILENLNIQNQNTHLIDLSHIESAKKIHLLGIIGYNLLKDYEVFVDLHLQQITLSKVDKYGRKFDSEVYAEKITDSIPFNLRKHSVILTAQVNDRPLKMALDTGAEYNLLSRSVHRDVLKFFSPTGKTRLKGMGNNSARVVVGKLQRMKLSESIYFGPMTTIIANLVSLDSAFGTNVDGVLGFEFFAHRRTIINYQKEKLYFIDYPIQKY